MRKFGITFANFQYMARNMGCSLRRIGRQYRVNWRGRPESLAIYTSNPFYALQCMEEMKRGIDLLERLYQR